MAIGDLTGKTFGSRTVISFAGKRGKEKMWLCRCSCGKMQTVQQGNLIYRGDKACQSCSRVIHGHTKSRKVSHAYSIWGNIIQRCFNPKANGYADYGGRGITVCDEWKSFECFLHDMGEPPTRLHTIDRIRNDESYSKDNCKWSTRKDQQRNRRNNIMITYNGKTMCMADWADTLGIKRSTLNYRIHKNWPLELALR